MKRLIHLGCSFAVGNAVPTFIPGLERGANLHFKTRKKQFEKKHGVFISNEPINVGKILADKLGRKYNPISQNGASNEMILRKLLHIQFRKTFVLIGITSHNRREGLTRAREKYHSNPSHWHTWKMIGPDEEAKYKDIRFDPWMNKGVREYYPAIEEEGQIRTAIQILYMQNFLKANDIPYLMYNSLYNGFDDPLTDECKKLLGMIDQKKYYRLQGSFNETQHGWCLKHKMVVSELDEHPNVEGQTAWAEQLMPLVEEIL